MAQNWLSSEFEKTPIAKSLTNAYPRDKMKGLERSPSHEVREALLAHIATINPGLAQDIMTSPAESNVMRIIWRVTQISDTVSETNKKFIISANDMIYDLAA